MTMQEFATAMTKATEVYGGDIISCRNGLNDGKLYVQLTPKNFDSLALAVTDAYPYESRDCQGDWQVEKQVDNVVFFVYHVGKYMQEVA